MGLVCLDVSPDLGRCVFLGREIKRKRKRERESESEREKEGVHGDVPCAAILCLD